MSTETRQRAPIRTAVLGYGFAGRIFHSPFVNAVPGLELTAIVQRHGETAAEDYPGIRLLRSAEEAFADPAIDLIVVATPNDSHVEMAQRALESGKHVVVDKPVAGSSSQVRALMSLAKRQGRLLAPFHNRRFDGDFLTVKRLKEEGRLGRITLVDSHYDRFRPLQRANTWKEAGGATNGILFDLGPHLVDQSLALFGIPKTISASVRHERDVTAIEDAFDIVLEFEQPERRPLRYECHATMLAPEPAPRFRVNGTMGSYVKFGLDPQEAALLNGSRPTQLGSPEPWLPEAESSWGTLTLATRVTEPILVERGKFPTQTGDYRRFYANVRDAIRGEAPLEISAEDAFRTIRLLELALEASDQNHTLTVDFTE
ncbi:MAG: Gfo/Idh/MocA family oxidoreductase [Acidobacteriota bacterium]